MRGEDLNVAYFQRNGFDTPLLFREKSGLGLSVPTPEFTINDVRQCVGSRRVLDVMDVATQKNSEMTMKEWQKYYENPKKTKLLNVISLEFSHTKLENYVRSPTVVRQIDWVDNVWPRPLKNQQKESTNLLEEMKYPKVQKYCLMSLKGCFTDFHCDFGGTSVWYHVLKGAKIFFLAAPTEKNLKLYQDWVLSGKQADVFLGDKVDKCSRIHLKAGDTFFIPTGWIHAVYTPLDSLVFGGNFLHSYSIEKQLKIARVEDNTKVPQKFRYPFFTEMLWYVLERYVHCLMGRTHLTLQAPSPAPSPASPAVPVHMTHAELHGLKEIVLYLHMLPANRKNVPELIKDPVALIQDVRALIGQHRNDRQEFAITNRAILRNFDVISHATCAGGENMKNDEVEEGVSEAEIKKKRVADKNGPRRRRTRCKKCEACRRNDCGSCAFCLDMVKFGGPGRAKQTCSVRQCLRPMLPVTAACARCGLDGWNQQPPLLANQKNAQDRQWTMAQQKERCESASNLMECSVCYEIVHPRCVFAENSQENPAENAGNFNDDLPNSWECPQCCETGKNSDYKPRHFRARQKSTEISKKIQQHEKPEENANFPAKKQRKDDEISRKNFEFFAHNSSKILKKPTAVVRPLNLMTAPSTPQIGGQSIPIPTNNLALDKRCVLKIFEFLEQKDLFNCLFVCKTWASYACDTKLWRKMEFSKRFVSSDMLKGIVRRQPEILALDWCHISKFQLPWLVQRLPRLRALSLQGVNARSASALKATASAYAGGAGAYLKELDLSFVAGFNDQILREILALGEDNRSRADVGRRCRFRHLKVFKIAGTDVTDISMRYVTQYLPELSELSLAFCPRITDAGIAQLSTKPAKTIENLTTLDLSHAKLITEVSLEHLKNCRNLMRLDLRHCQQVTTQSLIKFAANCQNRDLHVRDVKLVERRGAFLGGGGGRN